MVRKGWLLPLAHLMGISTVVNRFAATLQLPGCLRENGCCLELVTPRGCQSAVLAVWCATHPGDAAWGNSSACLPGWGCSALPSGILLCDCQITRGWAAASLEVAWEEKGHNPDWKKRMQESQQIWWSICLGCGVGTGTRRNKKSLKNGKKKERVIAGKDHK